MSRREFARLFGRNIGVVAGWGVLLAAITAVGGVVLSWPLLLGIYLELGASALADFFTSADEISAIWHWTSMAWLAFLFVATFAACKTMDEMARERDE